MNVRKDLKISNGNSLKRERELDQIANQALHDFMRAKENYRTSRAEASELQHTLNAKALSSLKKSKIDDYLTVWKELLNAKRKSVYYAISSRKSFEDFLDRKKQLSEFDEQTMSELERTESVSIFDLNRCIGNKNVEVFSMWKNKFNKNKAYKEDISSVELYEGLIREQAFRTNNPEDDELKIVALVNKYKNFKNVGQGDRKKDKKQKLSKRSII